MQSSSDRAIELEEQEALDRKSDWIRRELDDYEADESHPKWDELADQYDEMMADADQYLTDQYNWYEDQGDSRFFIVFKVSIEELRKILKSSINPTESHTIYKMIQAHTVTVMETYLGDTLKSAVSNQEGYLRSAAMNLKELKVRKFTLSEILQDSGSVKKIVLMQLDQYLYHDVVKVTEIYKAIFAIQIKVKLSDVINVVRMRHDIVHRNGKTLDNISVHLDAALLNDAIDAVERYVQSIELELNKVWPNRI